MSYSRRKSITRWSFVTALGIIGSVTISAAVSLFSGPAGGIRESGIMAQPERAVTTDET
jgi:hypothetical protein